MNASQSLDRAAKALMNTYVRAKPWNGDGSDPIFEGLSTRASPVSDNRYSLDQEAEGSAETAAKVFVSELDNYPLKSAHEALINIVLTVEDENIAIERVQTRLRTLLGEKLVELSKLVEMGVSNSCLWPVRRFCPGTGRSLPISAHRRK